MGKFTRFTARRKKSSQYSQTHSALLPEGPWKTPPRVIISAEGSAAFRDLIRSGKVADLTDPLGQLAGYVNEQIGGADYVRALQVREILQRKMMELFDTYDVLVSASQPNPAQRTLETNLETDVVFADPLGAIGNLCGLPAPLSLLSLCCGRSHTCIQ